MKEHRYIVPDPYQGCLLSVTYLDDHGIERVHHPHGPTLQQYLEEKGETPIRIISEDEANDLREQYAKSFETDAEPISEDTWWHLFECLPPKRYFNYQGWEFFCLSEMVYSYMTTWCAAKGAEFYRLNASVFMKKEDLLAKVEGSQSPNTDVQRDGLLNRTEHLESTNDEVREGDAQ